MPLDPSAYGAVPTTPTTLDPAKYGAVPVQPQLPATQAPPAPAPSPAWYNTQILHPDTWFGLQQAAEKADPKTAAGVFLHALHGAAQSAGQMTTPKNAAIVGGLTLANMIPGVGEVADGAVLGMGAKGIFDTGKDVYAKAMSGDTAGAEESLGQGIPNAVGTVYAGAHGTGFDAASSPLSRTNFLEHPSKIVGSPLTLAGKAVGVPAPSIAESALGITAKNRMYDRDPGKAILNDTSGFTPAAVDKSAETKLADLNQRSKDIAKNYQGTVSLEPALRQLMDQRAVAESRNDAPLAKDIASMFNHLGYDNTTPGQTGTPIPIDVPADKAIDLLHGFRQQFAKYNSNAPLSSDAIKIGNSVAHTLTKEINDTVPGIKDFRDRIANLIPVQERADMTERSAPLLQELFNKLKAPTGALVGAVGGYHEGGIPGAVLGLAGSSLLAHPAGQILLARALNAAGTGMEKAAPHVGQAVIKLPVVQQKP